MVPHSPSQPTAPYSEELLGANNIFTFECVMLLFFEDRSVNVGSCFKAMNFKNELHRSS